MEKMLPDGVTVLQNQGGGHMFNAKKGMVGIMQHKDGCLLKPVCPDASEQLEDDEVRFYERISKAEDRVDKELLQLMPKYYGTQKVTVGDREVLCVKVENFTRGFQRACVLDIKVGRVTCIPTAPEHKRAHEASKYLGTRTTVGFSVPGMPLYYAQPPSNSKRRSRDSKYLGTRTTVGFSVPGMSFYDVTAAKSVQLGKDYGKALNGDTVADTFRQLLNSDCGAVVRPICESLLTQLEDIQRWFNHQRKYRFFASSILLTYDAAPLEAAILKQSPDAILDKSRPVARMIDFAHAWPADGASDENYMEGLTNIIRLVRKVKDELK